MEYANRDREYNLVKSYLYNGVSPIVINAYHASGVTSFVKEKMSEEFCKLFGSNVYYIDASTKRSLSEMLFSCLVRSEHLNKLQELANKKLGYRDGNLLSAALEAIPYAGAFLGKLAEVKSAVPIYSGAYSSAMEEFLIPFFKEYVDNERILIIIDEVEALSEESFNLLSGLIKCSTVQCILIKTDNTQIDDKLENYLFVNDVNVSCYIDFDKPQIKLIKELGDIYGITITSDEAQVIIGKTNQNIHAIIKAIRDLKKMPHLPQFSAMESTIISILNIFPYPVDNNTLINITTMAESFSPNNESDCQEAISSLNKKGTISNADGWTLSSWHDPMVQKIINNYSDILFHKNLVYNYLRKREKEKYDVELRYHLSIDLKCTTPEDIRPYLRNLIVTGKDISQELMLGANLNKCNYNDCILASIAYCKERKYDEAFNWINAIPEDKLTDDIFAFKATLLNRIRRTSDAEKALISSINKEGPPYRQNILGAYLIATYIQMERMKDARATFEKMKELYANGPMHGYLVRNATSAYSEYQNTLYDQALSDFKHDGDDFGYYTTLCNKGYALCKNGDYENGVVFLEKAKIELEHFSQVHLHIIYNDLGLGYFMLDRQEEARRYLLLAHNLSRNSTPRIFTTINLACLEAVNGQTEQAKHRMSSIDAEVRNHKLDRVRQKYFINRLLVEYLCGNKQIDNLIKCAEQHLDRYHPERTERALCFYRKFVKNNKNPQWAKWRDLFSMCGLVYWYLDPLKLLPEGII